MNPVDSSGNEKLLREKGTELLTRMTALLRVARAYSMTNQVFQNQLEALRATIDPLVAATGEVVFVTFEGGLFLNGVRVPTAASNFKAAQGWMLELSRRGIVGFETRGTPEAADWQTFLEIFLHPDVTDGEEFVKHAKARGLERVWPAIAVSEDAPEEADADALAGAGAAGGGAAGAAGPGSGEGAASEAGAGAAGGAAGKRAKAARGAAPKRYKGAVDAMQSLLTRTSTQDGLEFRAARRVVQPLIDGIEERDPVVLGLTGLKKRDDFTYARNVNAVLVAVSIGQRLGLDRAALSDLAVAALLHGVGAAATSDPAEIGPAGAALLARSTSLNRTTLAAMRVALECFDQAPGAERGVLSSIVALAATYARLVSARTESGKSVTPAEALGFVVGPLAEQFDPALRLALIDALGFHPPGQWVELDGGDIALVVSPMPDAQSHPVVRVVAGPGGAPLVPGERWEGGPLPPERAIVRDLKAEEIAALALPDSSISSEAA